jgi:hypothetical protein
MAPQQRDVQTSPHQRAVTAKIALLHLVVIDRPGPQLLKQRPVLRCVFRGRKINTLFAAQFFVGETQKSAEGSIHKKRLPFQILDSNPDWTRVEDISKKLSIRHTELSAWLIREGV